MPIRYAIWAAVSTEAQAAFDKISLPDQQARCRAIAASKGWVEACGPFIVPGESRTKYINLRDAEAAIPPLRDLLNAAQFGHYDILVLYDYNRLRDLLDPVARTLASYHVQIYSLSQPVEPQPPEAFNANRADSAWMMQGLSQIVSRSQISDLRRKYETGMPSRVRDRGLPAISIPYGYRKPPGHETDRAAIPVPDPVIIPLILKFKDLLLQGRSLRQLVTFAAATGIHPPRGQTWHAATIRDLLRNPFYAGYNRWGLSKNYTDPRTGARYRNRDINPQDILVEKGRHDPLWDDATHAALVAELDRRGNAYRGKKATQLSRLLTCAHCKQPLWMQHNGSRLEPERSIWRCSNKACGQAAIHHSQAVEQLARLLQDEIRAAGDPGHLAPKQVDTAALEQSKLTELLKRRERLVDIYQDGGLSKDEYLKRRRELDNLVYATEKTLADEQARLAAQDDRLRLLNEFSKLVNHLPAWLERGDPQEINRLLHLLLAHIRVQNDQIVEIAFK